MSEEQLKMIEVQLLHQIKEVRECLGFSQRGLCSIINMSQPSLVKIENGLISPQLGTLLKVLEHLGLTIQLVPLTKDDCDNL